MRSDRALALAAWTRLEIPSRRPLLIRDQNRVEQALLMPEGTTLSASSRPVCKELRDFCSSYFTPCSLAIPPGRVHTQANTLFRTPTGSVRVRLGEVFDVQ
jgi:hypothetical protein